jgi:hypothetical protein
MFGEGHANIFNQVTIQMDSDGFLFQSDLARPNVPPRCHAVMAAQPIVSWTPARILAAGVTWLMEETPLPVAVPAQE